MTRHSKFVVGSIVLLAVAVLASTQVLSQEKGEAQPPADADMQEMMAKWAQINAKGPEHAKFQKMVGTWDADSKFWMGPEAEPMQVKAVAEFELILDGRYIQQTYACDWMGKPYKGIGIEGFDNMKKKYVSIWLGNDNTGIFMSLGTADESGKVNTYYGKMDDPMTGQKDKVIRSVRREINDNKFVFQMYDKPVEGPEYLHMEITYTRRK